MLDRRGFLGGLLALPCLPRLGRTAPPAPPPTAPVAPRGLTGTAKFMSVTSCTWTPAVAVRVGAGGSGYSGIPVVVTGAPGTTATMGVSWS